MANLKAEQRSAAIISRRRTKAILKLWEAYDLIDDHLIQDRIAHVLRLLAGITSAGIHVESTASPRNAIELRPTRSSAKQKRNLTLAGRSQAARARFRLASKASSTTR